MRNLKFKLIFMNFLEFAVWGAYLTSMGRYLGAYGFGGHIGWFYSIQGIVSLFMPALMGIVADRWIPAQKLLSLCHALAGLFMCAAGFYGFSTGLDVQFAPLFTLYTISVAFFMPTIALTNSVAFNALVKAGMDTVKAFPPIRVFGTVGFIVTMWVVDLVGAMNSPAQFLVSGGLSIVLAIYSLFLPACEINKSNEHQSIVEALGLKAFALFKQKKMALFFIFSMLLGMCLQVTNGYANPFLGSFIYFSEWSETFGVQHSGILISISQICEALCILAIPYFLKKFGSITFLAFLTGELIPAPVIHIFGAGPELTEKAVRAFHYVVAAFPLVGAQMVIGNFFQSIGHAGKSIFLSVTRQMLFLIPLLAILPQWWGLDGVWLSMPISDAFSFITAAGMLAYMIRKIKRNEANWPAE